MKEILNNYEFEVATRLISSAIHMAKQSMEQILQSPIQVQKIDFEHNPTNGFIPKSKYVHLVKTELRGKVTGMSYLIFSEDEVTKIYQACLPAEILQKNDANSQIMKSAVLAEIDNMVSAAVITELANFFNVDIYGHVPELIFMDSENVYPFITNEITEVDSLIHFKAVFQGTELQISPNFVWVFQKTFIDKIKEVA